jgi:hypothetical protein
MKKALALLSILLAGVVAAQTLDIRFKGTIDEMTTILSSRYFPDGGEEHTATNCFAQSAATADGGTWALAVPSAGPVTRASEGSAIRRCRRELHQANRMDGGNAQ